MLARPADNWEKFNLPFWRAFPYFLPCASAAAVSLTAFFVGFLWLKEVSLALFMSRSAEGVTFQTAPAVVKRHQDKEYKERRKYRLSQSESTSLLGSHPPGSRSSSPSPAATAPPLRALLTTPVIVAVLNYALIALSEISFTAVLPVYLASSPLSLTPRAIGIFIGGMGIFNGIVQALCAAALIERWGAKRMYQVSVCAYFPLWSLFPIAVRLAPADDSDSYPWILWLLACTGVVLATIMDMGFSTYFSHSDYPIVCLLIENL